jgi:hypothetical protein
MGLPPLTPEEWEAYRIERERAEAFTQRRIKVFDALGIKPIPEEGYKKYSIRRAPQGIIRPTSQCDKCGNYIHHHPIGAIKIGDDNWYDFLDLERTILKHLDKLGAELVEADQGMQSGGEAGESATGS